MSDAFDILPIIIPFFGVTICSGFIAICSLWRRVDRRFISLEHRLEQLSALPVNPPPAPPPTPSYPVSSYSMPSYPIYLPSNPSAVPYPLYSNGPHNV